MLAISSRVLPKTGFLSYLTTIVVKITGSHNRLRWSLALLLIFIATLASVDNYLANLLSSIGIYNDKIAHFLLYAVLTLSISSSKPFRKKLLWACLILALSVSLEAFQCLIPHRHGLDPSDLLVNSLGVTIGLVAAPQPRLTS